MRLVTGAVVPAFNNPLKLAGEIAMLDAISQGRLDVGFARAFLPHEFRRFKISPDKSVARFREGVEQIALLLTTEHATHHGQFHSFEDLTSLPRPTQKPRPKFFIASTRTPKSPSICRQRRPRPDVDPNRAAQALITNLSQRLARGRSSRRRRSDDRVPYVLSRGRQAAREIPRRQFEDYFVAWFESAGEWTQGTASKDYKGYDESIAPNEGLHAGKSDRSPRRAGRHAQMRSKTIIHRMQDSVGKFEHASLQINFGTLDFTEAQKSMRLFAREVMPEFS